MKIIDIEDMPNFNPIVRDGKDSVSQGKVKLGYTYMPNGTKYGPYPVCIEHGALLKVSKEGIWRFVVCHEGCYQTD